MIFEISILMTFLSTFWKTTASIGLEILQDNPSHGSPLPTGHVYFAEAFESKESFLKRWTVSDVGRDVMEPNDTKFGGSWRLEQMKRNSFKEDLGLSLKKRNSYQAISVFMDEPFEFKDKPLIVQYEVKFQKQQECGGAYIKLLSKDDSSNPSNFSGSTPYAIMFGPDKCNEDEKIHFIIRLRNSVTGQFQVRHSRQPSIDFGDLFVDKKIHLFTLAVYSNKTFAIYVDEVLINSGSILDDMIIENIYENLNPSVAEEGSHECHLNPNYQMEWFRRKTIYSNYEEDNDRYEMLDINALGLELWSVSSEIYFDNFIVASDRAVTDAWTRDGWRLKKDLEISNSEGLKGWFFYLWDCGLERQWLWGVYAFVFLLPFILISVVFCPESGPLFKASMVANARRPGEMTTDSETNDRGETEITKKRKKKLRKKKVSEDVRKQRNSCENQNNDIPTDAKTTNENTFSKESDESDAESHPIRNSRN